MRLLNTEKLLDPRGRNSIVDEHFKQDLKVERLLEIGCGSGVCLAWMQKYAEQCSGADIYLLPHLQQERLDSCSFLQLNANDRFPIEDSTYDVGAMIVLEHVFDPFHFCSEVNRILQPNGVFFLNVPLITAIEHRLTLLFGNLPVTSSRDRFEKRAWDGTHLHYFTLPLVRKLLNTYAFELDWNREVAGLH